MVEKLRFRCPCCGLVADVDRLSEGPYKVQAFLQSFGGKVSGMKHPGKGKAPGFMRYEDITKTEQGKQIMGMVKDRIGEI